MWMEYSSYTGIDPKEGLFDCTSMGMVGLRGNKGGLEAKSRTTCIRLSKTKTSNLDMLDLMLSIGLASLDLAT